MSAYERQKLDVPIPSYSADTKQFLVFLLIISQNALVTFVLFVTEGVTFVSYGMRRTAAISSQFKTQWSYFFAT